MRDHEELPEVLARRYQVLGVLGQGGFGRVLRVRDRELERVAALKLLLVGDDEQVRARFQREALLTAGTEHPHLVRVHDHGAPSGGPLWVAYEYLEGESGSSRVGRSPPPDVKEVVAWTHQLCGALDALHLAGVVHRDVKPANVMLVPARGAVLCDLGIAHHANATTLTSEGMILGTPGYMAPEVWAGSGPSAAADQFALACTAWALLAGTEPRARVGEPGPPDLPALPAGSVSSAVREVLERALAPEPGERWPDAGGLARALDAAASASRPPPPARTRALRQAPHGPAGGASATRVARRQDGAGSGTRGRRRAARLSAAALGLGGLLALLVPGHPSCAPGPTPSAPAPPARLSSGGAHAAEPDPLEDAVRALLDGHADRPARTALVSRFGKEVEELDGHRWQSYVGCREILLEGGAASELDRRLAGVERALLAGPPAHATPGAAERALVVALRHLAEDLVLLRSMADAEMSRSMWEDLSPRPRGHELRLEKLGRLEARLAEAARAASISRGLHPDIREAARLLEVTADPSWDAPIDLGEAVRVVERSAAPRWSRGLVAIVTLVLSTQTGSRSLSCEERIGTLEALRKWSTRADLAPRVRGQVTCLLLRERLRGWRLCPDARREDQARGFDPVEELREVAEGAHEWARLTSWATRRVLRRPYQLYEDLPDSEDLADRLDDASGGADRAVGP